MKRIRLTQDMRVNLSGYDRESVLLVAGEHEVSDHVAAWVQRNPTVGTVIGTAEASDGVPATASLSAAPQQQPQRATEDLEVLTVAELRERAQAAGLSVSGLRKADLVAVIAAHAEDGR